MRKCNKDSKSQTLFIPRAWDDSCLYDETGRPHMTDSPVLLNNSCPFLYIPFANTPCFVAPLMLTIRLLLLSGPVVVSFSSMEMCPRCYLHNKSSFPAFFLLSTCVQCIGLMTMMTLKPPLEFRITYCMSRPLAKWGRSNCETGLRGTKREKFQSHLDSHR